MDKKDIYEHLAKIYLDASSKKKNKPKANTAFFKTPVFLICVSAFAVGTGLFFSAFQKGKVSISLKDRKFHSETALVLLTEVTKINFNFDPAKKEIYSIDLSRLDLSLFKALGFSVRKAYYQDDIILKVEFSAQGKNSEVFVRNLSSFKWQDNKINLSDFKEITDWKGQLNLSFVIEDFNVSEKSGIVYIDNVRLLK